MSRSLCLAACNLKRTGSKHKHLTPTFSQRGTGGRYYSGFSDAKTEQIITEVPFKRSQKWDQKDNVGFLILHQYRSWSIDISKLLSIYTYYLRHIHFALVLVWVLGSSTFSRYICNTPGVLVPSESLIHV